MAITNGFEMVFNRRLIFGENKVTEIPGILNWYNKKKVLFVTFSAEFDAFKKISSLLTDAGMAVVPYEVKTEPTLQIIDHGRDIYVAEGCDCTIALGGGSVVDAAKVIGMLAVNGGDTEDYQMRGKAVTVEPPLFIAIPTTSGTGAEATKTSVVINNNNHLKKSLYHNTMIADVVVLDPSLTLALPARITAATGMDALSHAIESYVSLNATPITEMYGLKAIELVNKYLEKEGYTETTHHGSAFRRRIRYSSRRCMLHLPASFHYPESGICREEICRNLQGIRRIQRRCF